MKTAKIKCLKKPDEQRLKFFGGLGLRPRHQRVLLRKVAIFDEILVKFERKKSLAGTLKAA
jgi:hypothetical protein